MTDHSEILLLCGRRERLSCRTFQKAALFFPQAQPPGEQEKFVNDIHGSAEIRLYCFSVYGVHSKEKSCYQSWPHLTENHTTQLDIQVAHCTMQEYIHQMVAHGLQLMQQVVQPERGHAQRTVRLVAGLASHGGTPEVVV